jgi:hypothetical protein
MPKKRGKQSVPRASHKNAGLPPRDAWLIDPSREQIQTPTNEWGFVDIKKHIEVVKSTIDSGYRWSKNKTNCHHLYWPASSYSRKPGEDHVYSPEDFRELPISKTMLPVQFHNWLHRISEPPEKLPEDVMHMATESFHTHKELFEEARRLVRLQKHIEKINQADGPLTLAPIDYQQGLRPETSFHELLEMQNEKIYSVQMCLGQLAMIPEEFKLAEIKPEHSPQLVARLLGKIAAPTEMIMARRAIA